MNAKPFNFCCERRDLLCNRSNGDIFTCEGNMLFLRVNISLSAGKLTWYFTAVHIIKSTSLLKAGPRLIAGFK